MGTINASARGPPPEGPNQYRILASDPDNDPLTFGMEICYVDNPNMHTHCVASSNLPNPGYAPACSNLDYTCYSSLEAFSASIMPLTFDQNTSITTIDPSAQHVGNRLSAYYYVSDGHESHTDLPKCLDFGVNYTITQ